MPEITVILDLETQTILTHQHGKIISKIWLWLCPKCGILNRHIFLYVIEYV